MFFTTPPARAASCPKRPSNNCHRYRAEFDPAAYPIIARHFFGIEPTHLASDIAADLAADLKRLDGLAAEAV